MGTLIYGSGANFTFDDRVLSHLKIVAGMKLSRGESFFLSWNQAPAAGSEGMSVWVSPGTRLQFRFHDPKRPELNQTWLKAMADGSYGPGGLVLSEEPAAEPSDKARTR